MKELVKILETIGYKNIQTYIQSGNVVFQSKQKVGEKSAHEIGRAILEKKGFVDHRSFGKSHQYYPLVSREQYRNERFSNLMKDYFNNSMQQVLSHFGKSGSLNMKEADEIIKMMEEIKQKAGTDE